MSQASEAISTPLPSATQPAGVDGYGSPRAFANAIGAYLCWGVFGWYFQIVTRYVEPFALLAHRALWSLVFIVIVLSIRGELRQFAIAFRDRRVLLGLTATSLLVAINWITFIIAAHANHLVEASVGYFLSPLMTVLLGVVLLNERLRRGQIVAIAIAMAGVAILVVIKAGIIWIPLLLMISWSLYVLLRKRIAVGPMVGLGIETAILAPVALAYIGYDLGVRHTHVPAIGYALLATAGVITATPLMMLAYAARRLTMATLGLTQYVTPTVQFFVAAVVLREGVAPTTLAGFALIWVGLIVFTIEGYQAFRRAESLRG